MDAVDKKLIKLLLYVLGGVLGVALAVLFRAHVSFWRLCIFLFACFLVYLLIDCIPSLIEKQKLKNRTKPIVIDRRKAKKAFEEVESMGGLILFMNKSVIVDVMTQREDEFKNSIKLMISYIDDQYCPV